MEGIVIATISRPIIIRTILSVRPSMKATIWFLVKLDVNKPMETRLPARKTLPTYWEATAPQSMLPAVLTAIGIPRVQSIAIDTKIKPDRNLVIRTTQPRIGWVSRVSKVPSLCSSDKSRIVAAGIKRVISQGNEGRSIANSTVNKGLKDASPINKAVLKNAHDNIATNITMSM